MQIIYLAAAGASTGKKYTLDEIQNVGEAQGIATEQLNVLLEGLSNFGGSTSGGSWGVLIFFFTLAIGVSFFCSVWEAVLLSITRPYIASMKKKNKKTGSNLEQLKLHIDRPLISILTLNTIAHTVGSMRVASEFSKITGGGIYDTICSFFMTVAILIASEIIPKNLGARYWKAWGPWVGVCLHWLSIGMTPIVWLIRFFSKGGHHKDAFSREELTVMAEMGRMEGKLEPNESNILENLLQLRDASVEQVMTPRVVMFSLKDSTTAKEFIQDHGDTAFSRIPLYKDNRDDITGFVLKDDVLLAVARNHHSDDKPVSEWKRDVAMISELTKLPDAFTSLTENKHHCAIVHDEFGGVTGLVTMEDIMETLLGLEIVDEVDTRDDMQEFARRMWQKRSQRKGIQLLNGENEDSSTSSSASGESSSNGSSKTK